MYKDPSKLLLKITNHSFHKSKILIQKCVYFSSSSYLQRQIRQNELFTVAAVILFRTEADQIRKGGGLELPYLQCGYLARLQCQWMQILQRLQVFQPVIGYATIWNIQRYQCRQSYTENQRNINIWEDKNSYYN